MDAANTDRLVIVGGGPAALSAARGYRACGGAGEIRLISDDRARPYDRPPLSKEYLRGETTAESLPMEPAEFYDEQRVTVDLDRTVATIHPGDRYVVLGDGERLDYRTCVLATGAAPRRLPVPGADHPGVLVLRSLDDARALRAAAGRAGTAVIIGSGFIGCEAAASLAGRGLRVTVVSSEEVPHAARLGPEVGRRIAGWLREQGVDVIGGAEVIAVADGRRVELDGRPPVAADLILMATGVSPRTEPAATAGIVLRDGRIPVDERMRTQVPGILAAGDVTLARNAAAGRHLAVEHWGEAVAMGEIAGVTAAGGGARWDRAPGFWSTIGHRTCKYAAWGDGFDTVRVAEHGDGAFTAWYGREGVTVGVLTHGADDDYDRGRALVERHAPLPRR
ncbi:FAD-dependent oxidoreductase [Pseudonocardia acidicola]|uniref:FAD-dependent oxidoreductase n=1 Tax=Pseudonocardia acidicola TaxID=2724939 RepID=A0ABX1S9Q6_9PSEU|nr:FAD-dependent oxidoreductase [Pseudonocardia acidicola]